MPGTIFTDIVCEVIFLIRHGKLLINKNGENCKIQIAFPKKRQISL
jgi:hypothetical protein